MTSIFRQPEQHATTSSIGGIHDEAVPVRGPLSAGVMREEIRTANTELSREHLVFRWLSRRRQTAAEVQDPTYGLGSVPPAWVTAVPVPAGLPVPKKHGATRLRIRIKANITDGRVVDLFVGTSLQEDPTRASQSQIITLAGTGAMATYEAEDIRCRRGHGEFLTLGYRARCDPATDDLLDTGTFGGVSSGTIDSAPQLYSIRDLGVTWNATGSSRVHLGGHYIVVFDEAGAIRHGPAEIRAVGPSSGGSTDELYFWPPAQNQAHLVGCDYEIRQLPQIHIASIAIYTMETNA